MAEAVLDIVPVQADIKIITGLTYGTPTWEIKNAAGDSVNISTGYTLEIAARLNPDSEDVVFDEDDVDETLGNGELSFVMLKADTEDLTPGVYQWQAVLEATAGGRALAVYGKLTVQRGLIQAEEE
jgi:hypothetical protein